MSATTTNRYVQGNYAPVSDEVTAFDLPVIGELPVELEGRYLRNGPNPLDDRRLATHHWFVGDGMVHGVRLRGGRAEWYRNRYVGSSSLSAPIVGSRTSLAATGTTAPGGPNTNVGGFAGTTWAMVEAGGCPVELTYELETVGRNDFFGTLPGSVHRPPQGRSGHRRDARHGVRLAAVDGPRAVRRRRRRRQGSPHGRHPAARHDHAARHVAHAALCRGLRPAVHGRPRPRVRRPVPVPLEPGLRQPPRPAAA